MNQSFNRNAGHYGRATTAMAGSYTSKNVAKKAKSGTRSSANSMDRGLNEHFTNTSKRSHSS